MGNNGKPVINAGLQLWTPGQKEESVWSPSAAVSNPCESLSKPP